MDHGLTFKGLMLENFTFDIHDQAPLYLNELLCYQNSERSSVNDKRQNQKP